MTKCKCSINPFLFGGPAPRLSEKTIHGMIKKKVKCCECRRTMKTRGEINRAYKTDRFGNVVTCKECTEIIECFFCACKFKNLWRDLERNIDKVPLGNLTELLSPKARDYLIHRVDLILERRKE